MRKIRIARQNRKETRENKLARRQLCRGPDTNSEKKIVFRENLSTDCLSKTWYRISPVINLFTFNYFFKRKLRNQAYVPAVLQSRHELN